MGILYILISEANAVLALLPPLPPGTVVLYVNPPNPLILIVMDYMQVVATSLQNVFNAFDTYD